MRTSLNIDYQKKPLSEKFRDYLKEYIEARVGVSESSGPDNHKKPNEDLKIAMIELDFN